MSITTPSTDLSADPREQFAATASDLVETRPDVALVYAEISGRYFTRVARRHPERVINVGIREQLLVSAAAGMALTGIRPIVHTFGSFLVERAFEQIKLDLFHQGVGAVLVGSGGSFDISGGGRTHQSPGDVALLDTLPGITIHTPSTSGEVDEALRQAVAGDGVHYVRVVGQTNAASYPLTDQVQEVRRGSRGVILALGPVLDAAVEVGCALDMTVLYASTVRPVDAVGLRRAMDSTGAADIVLVEPWLEGTSAHAISQALADRPHRLLSLGVPRDVELRHYGTPEEHIRAHGLDAAGLASRVTSWLPRA